MLARDRPLVHWDDGFRGCDAPLRSAICLSGRSPYPAYRLGSPWSQRRTLSERERARITQYLRPIAERAYRVTLRTSAELIADNVIAVMDGMSERYADRLGVNPAAIRDGHRTLVKAQFSSAVSTVR